MRKMQKVLAGAAALALVGATTTFATVIGTTYTPDQAAFPGSPAINTTGTSAATVSTNFATNVPTSGNFVVDQSFYTNAVTGPLSEISFYSAGVATGGTGTSGTSVTVRLYALQNGAAGGGFEGGGGTDTYVFPNTLQAASIADSNPNLLAALNPTFDVTASASNRYITLDLSGSGVVLLPNTRYVFEIQNTSAVELDLKRAGATDFYTDGNIYGGTNTSATTAGNRGLPNSGGVRDGAVAVYVPEPTSIGLIGVTTLGLLRRKRRQA